MCRVHHLIHHDVKVWQNRDDGCLYEREMEQKQFEFIKDFHGFMCLSAKREWMDG